MNNLYKLKTLLESIKDNNLTAYEIGKETNISVVTIQRIINGETKKPNHTTIEAIQEYLEKNIAGTNMKVNRPNLVNEPEEKYNIESINYMKKYSECLEEKFELMNEIQKYKDLLVKNKIDFID